jgi:hypothetical protein
LLGVFNIYQGIQLIRNKRPIGGGILTIGAFVFILNLWALIQS